MDKKEYCQREIVLNPGIKMPQVRRFYLRTCGKACFIILTTIETPLHLLLLGISSLIQRSTFLPVDSGNR